MPAADQRSDAPTGSTRSPENRLDSWKAIASYLGRGVRTVQRWEQEEGLPVHRLAHEKRGSVYADKLELDTWWESRRQTLAETPDESAEPSAPAVPERVTWMGAATFWPALSSDGRLLAYISDGGRDGTFPQIWLQQIAGSPVCLTQGDVDRSHLSFAAGDTRLVFTASDDVGQNVYSMPTLGGEPRLLKRGARSGRISPDGKWLAYIAPADASGVHIASVDGTSDRNVASELTDIAFVIWSPDSAHVLVLAHPGPSIEVDYWVISVDGSRVASTGVLQHLRAQGLWPITLPAAWVGDSLAFSLITSRGVTLWRQRLAPDTAQPLGKAERLTQGTEMDSFATGAAGRVAFVSTHPDHNLWSVATNPATGVANGPPRRLTRGPGMISCLSVSAASGRLGYFFGRPGGVGLMLRDLASDSEAPFVPDPPVDCSFPVISPSGAQLAYGVRVHGPKLERPIHVATLTDRTSRKIVDDSGGRPREWVDERFLIVEHLGGRIRSVGWLDTVSGEQGDLISVPDQSVSNARLSPDRRWIAFDAARPGGPASVFVTPYSRATLPPEAWIAVDRSSSHPFWSADGAFLYYLPMAPSSEMRNVVRARRIDSGTGRPLGDPIVTFTSPEMVIPTMVTATAPIAIGDQIIFVLGDFRGDVWMIDLGD